MNKEIKFRSENIFFTADLHHHHGNIMKYCRRIKFMNDYEKCVMDSGDNNMIKKLRISQESIEQMDNTIIQNINGMVSEKDTLCILGDLGFFKHQIDVKNIIDKIHCRNIYYIMGNHDNSFYINNYISKVYDQVSIKVCNQLIVLNHYPMLRWDHSHHGSWQLFGHCHGNMNSWIDKYMPETKILDVGIDTHDYRPWSFSEIKRYMDTKNC